ncbi:flagellin N-terminal helical domain-containing protein [Clostridium estertheticum]|uniref:flagellin N-terminal helical domain-containing protein n=1 Tax=Clostridium estertheticum TaxID=238834 RepID=UPI001C7DFAB2|nr:flagellin [Clostridium estertheticum]MBX4265169.1 flagellin [Clostridium estertheticum]WLC90460.1 flagellin [Clostridium estertheticum]
MIINHNLGAMNANRNMGINASAANKSMEKLSSGLRINKAGDDAAGLAISEKMRGQIRGLDQSSANAQDGISMIQTAEGALSETTSIVQRLRELSVQSSSDTNNADDRVAVQKEVVQLKSEIDRIGNTTEFNTTKLIDGSIGAKMVGGTDNAAVISTQAGARTAGALTGAVAFNAGASKISSTTTGIDTTDQNITVDGAKIAFRVSKSELDAVAYDTTGAKFADLLQTKINDGISSYNSANDKTIGNVTVSAKGNNISITSGSTGATSGIAMTTAASGADNLWEIAGETAAVATLSNTGIEGKLTASGAANLSAVKATDTMNVNIDGKDIKVTMGTFGGQGLAAGADMTSANVAVKLAADINAGITAYNLTVPSDNKVDAVTVGVKDGAFVIQSGSTKATSTVKFDNSDAAKLIGVANQSSTTQGGGVDFQIGANAGQTMKITVSDMRTAALGIDKIDMSTKEGAQAATSLLDTALKSVSGQRADLGAFSNRLEHTIANLGTSSENLTSAESRIRDVDMAKEMSTFSKNNILNQAAQAMLAQANQQPQQVLALLR